MRDPYMTSNPVTNRGQAARAAVREKLKRSRRRRLAKEAVKLDPKEERALAEEGFAAPPSKCHIY